MTDKPVLLVTGASSGIGEAIAHRFAAGGYRIVAVARRTDRLEALAGALSAQTEVEIVASDVTAKDAAQRSVDSALKAFGRLDCLVNNAGSGKYRPLGDTDDATLDEILDTSLKAPIRFSRAALAVMRSGSSIIHIGSTFGIVAGINGGAYCAAKAGLNGLSQSIAADYGATGIRSNVVAPGVIPTEMTQKNWGSEVFRRKNQEMRPLDRDGTVEDVANLVYFLASPAGSYIQAQHIALDGGWTTTKYISPVALNAERVGRR